MIKAMIKATSKSTITLFATTLLAIITLASTTAWAQQGQDQGQRKQVVDITVTEIAGGNAYITPGEDAGLRMGQSVRIRNREYRVIAVTADTAVIDLSSATGRRRRGAAVREGDRGTVEVTIRSREQGGIAPPRPLSEFDGQWNAAVVPASTQNPANVPLGSATASGRVKATLMASVATLLPANNNRPDRVDDVDSVTSLWLGARIRAQPWRERPFGFDADVAVAQWIGDGLDDDFDLGRFSRSNVRVRELMARYGEGDGFIAGLGRLRYAASTLGLLDGARVESPAFLGGRMRVSAFGGVLPDPLDSVPDTEVARFGIESTYAAPDINLRPFISLVAHGSIFDGELDERRLSTYARVYPGPLEIMAHAELSMFDSDNPWGANTVELTAAGLDTAVRFGNTRIGVRFDARQPERSLFLQSLLSPQLLTNWTCTTEPRLPNQLPEPCNGDSDLRYSAAAHAHVELGRIIVSGGLSAIGIDSDDDTFETTSGFADVRLVRLFSNTRAHVGFLATQSRYLNTVATRISVGSPIGYGAAVVDASAYYRPAILSYSAAEDTIMEHRIGTDILFDVMPELDVTATVEFISGDDAGGIGLFATAVWQTSFL